MSSYFRRRNSHARQRTCSGFAEVSSFVFSQPFRRISSVNYFFLTEISDPAAVTFSRGLISPAVCHSALRYFIRLLISYDTFLLPAIIS